jgi:endonuclease/exonuclease/phosphatase family metal-dependent hydrolase
MPKRNEHPILRVATYNIHKGVQGLGPVRRLEIHNLGHAVEQLDADIVCLQEVRRMHRREERYFSHWPSQPQAEYLAPAMASMAMPCSHVGPCCHTSTRTCRTTVSSSVACCTPKYKWLTAWCM